MESNCHTYVDFKKITQILRLGCLLVKHIKMILREKRLDIFFKHVSQVKQRYGAEKSNQSIVNFLRILTINTLKFDSPIWSHGRVQKKYSVINHCPILTSLNNL